MVGSSRTAAADGERASDGRSDVLTTLRRNPVLFVPVLVWTLVQVPKLALQEVSPVLAGALPSWRSTLLLLVTPFVHAGLAGMADEALDGATSLRTFVRSGTDHFVSVLAAYLLFGAVGVTLGLGAVAGVSFLVLFGLAQSNLGLLALVGIAVTLAVVGYLLVLTLVQFAGHAIVIDGAGISEGLARSVAIVRRHLLRMLGYSVLSGIVGVVFAVGVVASYLWFVFQSPVTFGQPLPQFSPAEAAGGMAALVLVQTLVGGTFATYSVAVYRAISD